MTGRCRRQLEKGTVVNLARILLIVVALGMAGLTALLVNNYLTNKESEYANSQPTEQQLVSSVEVLVADRDIAAGEIVNDDVLRWQSWPEDALNENFVSRSDGGEVPEVQGAAVRSAIRAGEPIVMSKLVMSDQPGFLAGALRPGMRAVSVRVDEVTGNAGFIMPGNRVDVILTQEIEVALPSGDTGQKRVSETVLTDLRVLAIDQQVDDLEDEPRVSKTVTLEVDVKQAETVALVKSMGVVSLSLRSVARNDSEMMTAGMFTADDQISRFLSPIYMPVLTARHALKAGTLLRDLDIEWQALPAGADPNGLVLRSQVPMTAIRGALLTRDIDAATPLRQDMLIRPSDQGFIIAALNPGMRAVSVAITQVTGVSGYISPGDQVDVILTHEVKDTSDTPVLDPRRFAETIAEGVRLLAIETLPGRQTGKPRAGETVTLEVDPRQAEVIVLAQEMGKLSLTVQSVPALALERSTPRDEEAYTSDLFVSDAVADFLSFGTRRAPQLLARIGQRNRSLASAPARRSSSGGTVRVYRSTAQSTVQIRR